MKEFWNSIQLAFAAVGGWLGYFLGGCDGLLIALIIFAVCDYITGVMCAIVDKKLSSEVGFKGIVRPAVNGVTEVIRLKVKVNGVEAAFLCNFKRPINAEALYQLSAAYSYLFHFLSFRNRKTVITQLG